MVCAWYGILGNGNSNLANTHIEFQAFFHCHCLVAVLVGRGGGSGDDGFFFSTVIVSHTHVGFQCIHCVFVSHIWAIHIRRYCNIVKACIIRPWINCRVFCVTVAFLARKFSSHHKVLCARMYALYGWHECCSYALWRPCSHCVLYVRALRKFCINNLSFMSVCIFHYVFIVSFICVLPWHLSNILVHTQTQMHKNSLVLSRALFHLISKNLPFSCFCATHMKIT